jgi:hypothetical protein
MFIQQEKPRLTGRAKKHTAPDGVAKTRGFSLRKPLHAIVAAVAFFFSKALSKNPSWQHHRLANGHADEVGL